jgi:hypothetical protein
LGTDPGAFSSPCGDIGAEDFRCAGWPPRGSAKIHERDTAMASGIVMDLKNP